MKEAAELVKREEQLNKLKREREKQMAASGVKK